jgi:two-component system, chemotaxis family, chemotaxis protein CheY
LGNQEVDLEALLAEIDAGISSIDHSQDLNENELEDLRDEFRQQDQLQFDQLDSNSQSLSSAASGTLRILIVDDSSVSRLRLKAMFKKKRAIIDEAGSGNEAFEFIQHVDHYDLMTLDYNMPCMNGLELVEALNKVGKLPTTIIISTENEKSVILQALGAGVQNYIIKPFEQDSALKTITQVLKKCNTPLLDN